MRRLFSDTLLAKQVEEIPQIRRHDSCHVPVSISPIHGNGFVESYIAVLYRSATALPHSSLVNIPGNSVSMEIAVEPSCDDRIELHHGPSQYQHPHKSKENQHCDHVEARPCEW